MNAFCGYLDVPEKLENDFEIQSWAEELVSEDGCSLKVSKNLSFRTEDGYISSSLSLK